LPTQWRFFNSAARHPAYIGGYGSGKTYIGCLKALALALRNAPLPGGFVEPTSSNLRDIAIPMFNELLESAFKGQIPHEWRYSPYPNLTLFPKTQWATEIWLRSGDKPESLKGPNLAWAGVDEIARIRKEIWGVVVSRVRHPGARQRQAFATGTPDEYWVAEYWEEEPQEGYELFRASSLENIFLDDEYIRSLRMSHSEEELARVIDGQFVRGGIGRVYKAFARDTHVRDTSPHNPDGRLSRSLPLCLTCDFNIDPCIWLVAQCHGGVIYFADEIVGHNTDTVEMAEAFLEKYRGWNTIVYGDAAGKSKTTAASKSDYELLKRIGLRQQSIPPGNPAVKDRVNALNAKLKGGDGKTRLYVHPDCQELIKDFEWVTWQGSMLDKRDSERTHASDAAGYLIHREYPIRRPKPPTTRVARVRR